MKRLFVSVAALLVAASTAQAAEIRVLSGNGAKAAVRELCAQFERATGNTIKLHFEVNADLKKRSKPVRPLTSLCSIRRSSMR